jgi:hypothetical protein
MRLSAQGLPDARRVWRGDGLAAPATGQRLNTGDAPTIAELFRRARGGNNSRIAASIDPPCAKMLGKSRNETGPAGKRTARCALQCVTGPHRSTKVGSLCFGQAQETADAVLRKAGSAASRARPGGRAASPPLHGSLEGPRCGRRSAGPGQDRRHSAGRGGKRRQRRNRARRCSCRLFESRQCRRNQRRVLQTVRPRGRLRLWRASRAST